MKTSHVFSHVLRIFSFMGIMGLGFAGTVSAAGTSDQSQPQAQSQSQSQEQQSQDAQKMALGPHSIMIQSSLKEARDQLNGLRSQLDLAKNQQPSRELVQHLQMHRKEINDNLKAANAHSKELQGSIQSFPNLAQDNDYRSFQSEINNLESLNRSWQSKAASSSYWNNRNQVKADLDSFEKRLDNTLNKLNAFSSDQLKVAYAG